MFNIDREKLKMIIDNSISSHSSPIITSEFYVSANASDTSNYKLVDGFESIIKGLDIRVQNQIRQAFELHTKTMLREVMFDLIDSLYSADDFENDLKLR